MAAEGSGDDLVVGVDNYEITPTRLVFDMNAEDNMSLEEDERGHVDWPVFWAMADNTPGVGVDGLWGFGLSCPGSQRAVGSGVVGMGLENDTGVGNGVVGYSSNASTIEETRRDYDWEADAHAGVAGQGPTGVAAKGDRFGVKAEGGIGVWATGAGTGPGVLACGGDGGGEGVNAGGRGGAAGVAAVGGDQGPGIQASGGRDSRRAGIEARGGAAGGEGVYALGFHRAAGVRAYGGADSGVGLVAYGGQPDGHRAGDGGGAHGVEAHGSDDNGAGVWAAGGVSAPGVIGLGGDRGGPGVSATGGDGGAGVVATGGDGGVAVVAMGTDAAGGTAAQIRLVLPAPAGDPNANGIAGQPGDLLAVPELPVVAGQPQGDLASLWFCTAPNTWRRVNLI
jgi:hypothetical protein